MHNETVWMSFLLVVGPHVVLPLFSQCSLLMFYDMGLVYGIGILIRKPFKATHNSTKALITD